MLQSESALAQEQKEQNAIENRRRREQERKRRFLDPKTRMMGVDRETLEKQIHEKKERERLEKERELLYAQEAKMCADNAATIEEEINRQRKEAARNVDEYRKVHQTKESRREFDLSDPEYLRKDIPARVSDDDPRCGVSSVQVLEGEDLAYVVRKKAQQSQLRNWADQQIQEKEEREEEERRSEELYAGQQMELNSLAQEIEKRISDEKKAVYKATRDYNLAQAEAKQDNDSARRENEQREKLEEIRNHLENKWLAESFDTTVSAATEQRFRPDHFKGLSMEAREDILQERARQIEMRNAELDRKKAEEEADAQLQERYNMEVLALERQVERERRKMSRELLESQQQQDTEFKQRTRQIDEVYANKVKDDFFDQFGTSAR